jgi:D-alanine-D-alanine ligase
MVLMGGRSAEREVSLDSGRACAAALEEAGYHVDLYDFDGDVAALVAALDPKPDAVFNALHGRWGEDGCVQGLLELLDIPYSHSGLMASALAMNKPMAKSLVAAAGITCPDGMVVTAEALATGDPMPRPYVVKPIAEGSSVGVHIIHVGDNRAPLGDRSWQFGEEVLVEKYIEGRELTVTVMGDRALEVTELRPTVDFYDYEAKYTDGVTEHLVPAPINPTIREQALAAALSAHQLLSCRGVTRSDFRYDDTGGEPGRLYYLETNTQPGMTALSLVPEQAAQIGISFPQLCAWMVENASCGG